MNRRINYRDFFANMSRKDGYFKYPVTLSRGEWAEQKHHIDTIFRADNRLICLKISLLLRTVALSPPVGI